MRLRRIGGERPGGGVLAWIAGFAAVVVAAAAAIIGGSAPALHQDAVGHSRTTDVARQFVCSGGLPGAVAQAGTTGDAPAGGLTFSGAAVHALGHRSGQSGPVVSANLGAQPLMVLGMPETAGRAYAVRTAHAGRWFAAGACPGPSSDWWFVGAGGSQAHHTTMLVTNPLPGNALMDVEVFGPKGVVAAPGLDNLNVASGATMRLDLARVAPAVGDLAVHIRTSRGLVAVSAPQSWSPDFVVAPTRDWVPDQPSARRKVSVSGLLAGARSATALIANPGTSEAVVTLTLVGPQGTYAPTRNATVRVPPQSVQPVPLSPLLRTRPAGVTFDANVPIAATIRSTAGTDSAYAPVLRPLGSAAAVGIPAHPGPASLILVAGELKTEVGLTGYAADGRDLGTRTLRIPARASLATSLWPAASAIRVTGGGAAGGVVVLGSGRRVGPAVIAMTASASEARVPPVAPASMAP